MTPTPRLTLRSLNPYSEDFVGAHRVARMTPTELQQLRQSRSFRMLTGLVGWQTLLVGWLLAGALALGWVVNLEVKPAPVPPDTGLVIVVGAVVLLLAGIRGIAHGRDLLQQVASLEHESFLVAATLKRLEEYSTCRQYRDKVLDSGRELVMADFRIIEWLAHQSDQAARAQDSAAQWNKLHSRELPQQPTQASQ